MEKRRFKHLAVGTKFDFINDETPGYNSFFERCTKISSRVYETESGVRHLVGSINAVVYHVEVPK